MGKELPGMENTSRVPEAIRFAAEDIVKAKRKHKEEKDRIADMEETLSVAMSQQEIPPFALILDNRRYRVGTESKSKFIVKDMGVVSAPRYRGGKQA